MKQSVWTPEKERKLKRLVKDGALVVTLAQATVLLGVGHYALVTYCQKHDIKTRFANVWTGRHQARLNSYVRDGRLTLTINAAAKKLGVPPAVLSGQLARQGIETLNSAGEVKRRTYSGILSLTTNGVLTVSLDIACARIGCSRYAAEDAVKDLKIRLPGTLPASGKRMGKPSVFTTDAVRTLQTLTNGNGTLAVPIAEAARQLGAHPKSLGNFMRRTGVARPHVPRYDWTDARRHALKGLCRDGILTVSTSKAASLLDCTYGQLQRGLRLTGLMPKPKTKWTREKILSLGIFDADGRLAMSMAEASAKLGTDRKTLRSIMAMLAGPTYVRYAWTPERIAKLRAYAKDGVLTKPLTEVMHAMGCSEKVLKLHLDKLGLLTKPRFSWTPEAVAKLDALKGKDGKLIVTYEKAATLIGCGKRSIESKLLGNNKRH